MIWVGLLLLVALLVATSDKPEGAWVWVGLAGVVWAFRSWRRRRSYPAARSKAYGATPALLRKAQAKERELLLTLEPKLLPNGEMGEQSAWERATGEAGISGAALQQIEGTLPGFTYQIELRSGGTMEEVQSAKGKLESALNLLRGAVTVDPGERARVVLLKIREGAPERDPIPWPGAPADASITKPTVFGTYQEGGPLELLLRNKHILIAGATDSGKSGVLNALVGYLTACSDVVLLGIDCKPGAVELRPWAPVLQRLATSTEDARKLLRMAFLELERRGDLIGGGGGRKWSVSPRYPAWVIVIDELRELTLDDECRELLERLTSLARFADVTVIGATQYPTKQDLKSSVLVEQMTTKIALYVETPTASRVIFGDKAAQQGWKPDEIDGGPGTLYLRSREARQPKLARAFYVTDAKVRETVERYRDRRPVLVTARPAPAPVSPFTTPAGSVPANDTKREEPDGSGGGEVALILGQLPATLDQLAAHFDPKPSRTTIYRRLVKLRDEDGRVEHAEGVWRLVP